MRPFLILAIFGFPLKYPFPRDERLLTVRGPVRGSPRRARSFGDCLSSRAGSAVPRDAKRNPVNKLFLYVLTFNMQITHRCPTMLSPRGHQSAYRLNQRRTERRAFFIQAALGFPLNTPPPTRQALAHRSRSCKGKSPKSAVVRGLRYRVAREARFRATFSVPNHLWGAAQVTP